MASGTELAATFIGREAVDSHSRHIGWVIAVIHRARGADVLIERRGWFRRRSYRIRLSDIGQLDDRRVVIAPYAMWHVRDAHVRAHDAATQRR